MREVMVRAWEIAREGQRKFGGKVKEYFAISLKLAWKEVKSEMKKAQLKGTPKQVAWAETIRKNVLDGMEETFQKGVKWFEEQGKRKETYIKAKNEALKQYDEIRKTLCAVEDATYWISHWQDFYKTKEKVDKGVMWYYYGSQYRRFRSVYAHGE